MQPNSYKYEQYNIRYDIDGLYCKRCGMPATEIAHRLNANKSNIKKYGDDIINHNINMVVSCQKCNSYFSISNRPQTIKALVDLILTCGSERLKYNEINDILGVAIE